VAPSGQLNDPPRREMAAPHNTYRY